MDRPRNIGGSLKRHCGCCVERVCDRSQPPKERYRQTRIARKQKEREELSDSYIRKLFVRYAPIPYPAVTIPQPLVDVKREVLRIERFIKQSKEKVK